MHGCGYDPGPGLYWFPECKRRPEDDAKMAQKARENAPGKVLGEIGIVLAVTFAIVLAIDAAPLLIHVF
jgi:hypothetical protein